MRMARKLTTARTPRPVNLVQTTFACRRALEHRHPLMRVATHRRDRLLDVSGRWILFGGRGLLAGFGPGRLLAGRAANNGRCAGRIASRIAGRGNNITGRIGILRRVRPGDGAPRVTRVLRKRILFVCSMCTGADRSDHGTDRCRHQPSHVPPPNPVIALLQLPHQIQTRA